MTSRMCLFEYSSCLTFLSSLCTSLTLFLRDLLCLIFLPSPCEAFVRRFDPLFLYRGPMMASTAMLKEKWAFIRWRREAQPRSTKNQFPSRAVLGNCRQNLTVERR